MIELDLDEAKSWFGFGVAGNFAGHLEQAGEAVDFVNVKTEGKEGSAPKGIFPWYAPGHDSFLGEFPLSHDALMVPKASESDGPLNLQIEPEVGLACDVVWDGDTVVTLRPFALGAFNDCSIRRPNAPKISYKKNWGPASKGVAQQFFDIGDLTPDGVDRQIAIVLDRFADHPHARAVLHTTLAAATPTTASISGSAARIELDGPFYTPGPVRLVRGAEAATWPGEALSGGEGMCYEAAHFAKLVADAHRESPLLPLDETVAIMAVMDEIRAQVGVRYPGE